MQRWTSQMLDILDIVYADSHFMSADEVYAMIKQRKPSISLATVYRNLNKMVSHGLVAEVSYNDMGYFTKHPFSNTFFVCTECKKLFRVDSIKIDNEKMEEESGLKITKSRIVLEGICRSCVDKCT